MELNQLEKPNTLDVNNCPQLEAIDGLSSLTGLQTLTLEKCSGLKWLPCTLSNLRRLEKISIKGCREIESVEGAEQLPVLTSLFIGIPDDGHASWVRHYICGLKKFPVKKIMQIIFEQEDEMSAVSSKMNANMFSGVVDAHEVSEIEMEENNKLKMSSSSSAITIYALLLTVWAIHYVGILHFESEGVYNFHRGMNYLITVVLTQHDIEGSLSNVRVKKGLKVTMKVGEEGKALSVLHRIADQLYPQSMPPNLVANDVVKKMR